MVKQTLTERLRHEALPYVAARLRREKAAEGHGYYEEMARRCARKGWTLSSTALKRIAAETGGLGEKTAGALADVWEIGTPEDLLAVAKRECEDARRTLVGTRRDAVREYGREKGYAADRIEAFIQRQLESRETLDLRQQLERLDAFCAIPSRSTLRQSPAPSKHAKRR